MAMVEPDWLGWTRELQAIAQTGIEFVRDPYDRERYEMLRALASRMMAAHTNLPPARIETLFEGETGYATPKVDVRGAAFDARGRLLMVREVADGGRWTRCKQAIQTNNVETDARGLIYIVDRANTGVHILKVTGEPRTIAGLP